MLVCANCRRLRRACARRYKLAILIVVVVVHNANASAWRKTAQICVCERRAQRWQRARCEVEMNALHLFLLVLFIRRLRSALLLLFVVYSKCDFCLCALAHTRIYSTICNPRFQPTRLQIIADAHERRPNEIATATVAIDESRRRRR